MNWQVTHFMETDDIPPEDVDKIVRLTKLSLRATDPDEAEAYREHRDSIAEDHEYLVRLRDGDTVICHPEEWLDDEGKIKMNAIDDTDRAIEREFDTGRADESWERIDSHNKDIARRVFEEYGATHGENAKAFADYMSNHVAKRVEDASSTEIDVFLRDYYPRNAWPSDEQRTLVVKSIRHMLEIAEDAQD
ncbi:MAG: rnhA operon protein, partial [Halobacteriaceae archaeon]